MDLTEDNRRSISFDETTTSQIISALTEIIETYKPKPTPYQIPLSILANSKHGIIQTSAAYLKAHHHLRINQISRLLGRDRRYIWSSIQKIHVKLAADTGSSLSVPATIFCDPNLSPLECITRHLREDLKLELPQIAILLKRQYHSIWLANKKTIQKQHGK